MYEPVTHFCHVDISCRLVGEKRCGRLKIQEKLRWYPDNISRVVVSNSNISKENNKKMKKKKREKINKKNAKRKNYLRRPTLI
jgi:hypothetical protein